MEKRMSRLRRKYPHAAYLLYWPIYGIAFLVLERLWVRETYASVSCALDEKIPFLEGFLFPYLFWFVYLIGSLVYGFFREPEAFRAVMRFIIPTFSTALVIYAIFPNCQGLRPAAFPRDNALTRFIAWLYAFDTNTNVCPSLHVIGAIAPLLLAWSGERFSGRGWRVAFVLATMLICVSTVFIKQHSVVDVLAALPISALGLRFARRPDERAQIDRNSFFSKALH